MCSGIWGRGFTIPPRELVGLSAPAQRMGTRQGARGPGNNDPVCIGEV